MTIQKSVVMMTHTGNQFDVTSDKFRADGYWGHSDGLHTISIDFQHLKANFYIQGTLSTDPQEEDWFDIDINNTDHNKTFIQFNGESGVNGFSFVGNFTYLRSILSRTCQPDLESDTNGNAFPDQGQIDKVLLAM